MTTYLLYSSFSSEEIEFRGVSDWLVVTAASKDGGSETGTTSNRFFLAQFPSRGVQSPTPWEAGWLRDCAHI